MSILNNKTLWRHFSRSFHKGVAPPWLAARIVAANTTQDIPGPPFGLG